MAITKTQMINAIKRAEYTVSHAPKPKAGAPAMIGSLDAGALAEIIEWQFEDKTSPPVQQVKALIAEGHTQIRLEYAIVMLSIIRKQTKTTDQFKLPDIEEEAPERGDRDVLNDFLTQDKDLTPKTPTAGRGKNSTSDAKAND